MATAEHRELGTGATAALLADLQDAPIQRHRVIPRHDPSLLVTGGLLELVARDRDEGGRGISAGDGPKGWVRRSG